MSKPLFTKEEAERLAAKVASDYLWGSVHLEIARNSFFEGIAAAEAEFQKRLEEAPTVYGSTGEPALVWTRDFAPSDLYKAKLINIEPIGEEKKHDPRTDCRTKSEG